MRGKDFPYLGMPLAATNGSPQGELSKQQAEREARVVG
jgi:hypothetical protein